jgi:hypothetical protein
MSSTKAQILEDETGGIHWVTFDGMSCSIGGVEMRDRRAGRLLDELVSILDWIDGGRADCGDDADRVEMNAEGKTVIAEIDVDDVVTIHVGRMGASGRAYAGVHT